MKDKKRKDIKKRGTLAVRLASRIKEKKIFDERDTTYRRKRSHTRRNNNRKQINKQNIMDLESYIGRYTGETRLRRLISIAQGRSVYGAGNNNSNLNLTLIQRQHALDLAEKQMIKDGNVQLYRQVFAGNGNNNGEDTGGGGGGRIFDMDLFESKFTINLFLLNFF